MVSFFLRVFYVSAVPVGVEGLHQDFIFNGSVAVEGNQRRIRRCRIEGTPGLIKGGKRRERRNRGGSYVDSEGEYHASPDY